MQKSAVDIAKWFIKNNLDSPRDTYDGNMKLQKLLYFAQLIHVAKYNNLLFNEEMRAYVNGTVINDVRLKYKSEPSLFVSSAYESNLSFDCEAENTLQLTKEIFGEMTALELSELNHELDSWKIPFHTSVTDNPGFYNQRVNKIDVYSDLFLRDVQKIKEMLGTIDENNDDMEFEVINGITFYYDSNTVNFDEDIITLLESLDCPEDVYTVTIDEIQGVIIS